MTIGLREIGAGDQRVIARADLRADCQRALLGEHLTALERNGAVRQVMLREWLTIGTNQVDKDAVLPRDVEVQGLPPGADLERAPPRHNRWVYLGRGEVQDVSEGNFDTVRGFGHRWRLAPRQVSAVIRKKRKRQAGVATVC